MTETSVVDMSAESPRYREAFQRSRDERRAIPADDLLTLNVDPQIAVTTTLTALPAIKAMRSRLMAEITNFDVASFDKLEDYAMALSHANTAYLATAPDATNFEALLQECDKQREILQADLSAAVARGHINGERMKELRGGAGPRNVIHDVFILVQIARTDWAKLEGKTFITLAQLNRSERLTEDLNSAVAERERQPGQINEASEERLRAFTLFARTHGKTRRAIQYLRDEFGDTDEIMPSFYNGRASGRKRPEPEPSKPPEPPVTTPVVGAAPAPVVPAASARIGMPGSDPFTP
jgi:hypothetical protein